MTNNANHLNKISSGDILNARVKFSDNRSFEYTCSGKVAPGDIVFVEGAKQGQYGMVTALTGSQGHPGYRRVTHKMER